jgi:hypothetical protein
VPRLRRGETLVQAHHRCSGRRPSILALHPGSAARARLADWLTAEPRDCVRQALWVVVDPEPAPLAFQFRPRRAAAGYDRYTVAQCAELADTLLEGCPTLRLLATSRSPLHISWERTWRVPSLRVPDACSTVSADQLVRYPAIQLFVERAQAVQSTFALTPSSVDVVGTICARLEGLPLAIELAAAWVRAFGVEQILERLDDRQPHCGHAR